VRHALRRHFFLLTGVISLPLFFLTAGMGQGGGFGEALSVAMRILIVPAYLVWMLIAIVQAALVGPHGLPGSIGIMVSGLGMIAGLAPYAVADYILDRIRRARH